MSTLMVRPVLIVFIPRLLLGMDYWLQCQLQARFFRRQLRVLTGVLWKLTVISHNY